jgi:hypothetical protein
MTRRRHAPRMVAPRAPRTEGRYERRGAGRAEQAAIDSDTQVNHFSHDRPRDPERSCTGCANGV